MKAELEVVAEPKEDGRWFQVRLPDDRAGWVQAGRYYARAQAATIPETLEFSKRFLGLPYLWGGTSSSDTIAPVSFRCFIAGWAWCFRAMRVRRPSGAACR